MNIRIKRSHAVLAVFMLSGVALLFAAAGDGVWLTKVPEKDRVRLNPLEGDAEAPLAGEKLFRQNCVSCHGTEAQGKGKRPGLHAERIRGATSGELQWLLTNGSLRNGMPSWTKLPEPQRWQIVSYLKTLR